MQVVVLQFGLHREAAVAGDLRRVVAPAELAAAHAELLGREQRLAERRLRGGRQVQVEAIHHPGQVLDALGVQLQLGEVGAAALAGRVQAVLVAGAHDLQALAQLALHQVLAAVAIEEVVAGAQADGADAVVAGGRQVRIVEVLGAAIEPGEGSGRLEGLVALADPGPGNAHCQGIAGAVGVEEGVGVGEAVIVLGEEADDVTLAAHRQFVLAFEEGHLVALYRLAGSDTKVVAQP
ncbi:hypothetical protein FQZ97_784830 [compost metagenome]